MRLLLDPLREQFFPQGLPEGERWYRPGPVLDQGPTGTCVAHGCACRVQSGPIMQPLPQGLTPYQLYRQIVLLDEWAENDAEATGPDAALQFGTSVRAGLKALQNLDVFSNYLWAESAEDVRGWMLAGFGPVVLGITWRTGMMVADADGFINFTGNIEGGHSVCTTGWDDTVMHRSRTVRAVRIQNSWGTPWGHRGVGRAYLEYDDLQKALEDDGEAGAPTEVRVKPPLDFKVVEQHRPEEITPSSTGTTSSSSWTSFC